MALGLLLVLAAGCGGGIRPEVLQAWVGRPAAALEKDWGPPTREVADGDQRVLIYEEVQKRSRGSSFEGTSSAIKRGESQLNEQDLPKDLTVSVRSYQFWVDGQGKIVRAIVRTH